MSFLCAFAALRFARNSNQTLLCYSSTHPRTQTPSIPSNLIYSFLRAGIRKGDKSLAVLFVR